MQEERNVSWEVFLDCFDMQLLILCIPGLFILDIDCDIMGVLDMVRFSHIPTDWVRNERFGVGAFTLDWAAVSAYLYSAMVPPTNVLVGFVIIIYISVPAAYWGTNLYEAKTFPILFSDLFTANGQSYNITAIVNNHSQLDKATYERQGRIHLSMSFALTYGLGFCYHFFNDYPCLLVLWKVYGYVSMNQAVAFLSDFKLGHYMKIPPCSMFLVQFVETIIASGEHVPKKFLLPPGSPWTCSADRVFFHASVIWGLVSPKRIFGELGIYPALNWFFLGGAVAPLFVWLLHKALLKFSWISLINMPVLLGATTNMPPATPVNHISWITMGTIFNFFAFRYHKSWWQHHNYVLSVGLDAGLAFMAVLLYFSVSLENKSITSGTSGEHCPLALVPQQRAFKLMAALYFDDYEIPPINVDNYNFGTILCTVKSNDVQDLP